jgi:hypothetical protein
MKIKVIAIITVFLTALAFNACDGLFETNETILTINLGGKGRAVFEEAPTPEMLEQMEFKVTLTGNGDTLSLSQKGAGSIRVSVTPGSWVIKIEAWEPEGLFATGSAKAEAVAGRVTSVSITMYPPEAKEPITDNPLVISSVEIQVTSPEKGELPVTTARGEGNFTIGAVTWSSEASPAFDKDDAFLGNTIYTAALTLTATGDYTFKGIESALINSNAATIKDNTGETITLSYTFGATFSQEVSGIIVSTQPSKLVYTYGESLSLEGLVIRILFTGDTYTEVPFAEFGENNISAAPSNGTALSLQDNEESVKISYGAHSAETAPLTVSPKNITFTVGSIDNQTYTGSELTPAVTVRDGAGTTPLTPDTDYTVIYSNNLNVGTAAVAITGAGNYAGSSGSASFTIVKAALSVTLELSRTVFTPLDGETVADISIDEITPSGLTPTITLDEIPNGITFNSANSTITYDGNEFADTSVTLAFVVDAGANYNAATVEVEISIYDGQAKARAIPVNQDNIMEFNTYASEDGLSLHYRLEDDISWNPSAYWTPIGYFDWYTPSPFTGTFDGGGKTITGLEINNQDGLFGYVDGDKSTTGIIQNLNLKNATISGDTYGGIVGINDGLVENCSISGTSIITALEAAGGIVGKNNGTVQNCYNTGSVTGTSEGSGGIAGMNFGMIANCYNTGDIGGDSLVGGVAGYNSDYSTVQNCYNTGNVTGGDYTGGVVGYNSSGSTVQNCYNTGNITGNDYVGGVAGDNGNTLSDGLIQYCYSTGTVQGENYVGGIAGRTESSSSSGNNKVKFCVALNTEIIGSDPDTTIRVANGYAYYVFARSDMIEGWEDYDDAETGPGASVSEDSNTYVSGGGGYYNKEFWQTVVNFSDDIWTIEDNQLPELQDMP